MTEEGAIATILVQRRLDDSACGSTVYFLEFLNRVREAELRTRLVIAPIRGFGSKPWVLMDDKVRAAADEIVWPRTLRLGAVFIALSPRVWARGAFRMLGAVKARLMNRPRPACNMLGEALEADERRILTRAAMRQPSLCVIAEYSSLGPVLADIDAPCRAVLLHDLFSMRAQVFQEKGRAPDHAVITLDEEIARLAAADLVLHASMSELDTLKARLPDKAHIWMRPPVEAAAARTATGVARAVFLGVRHGGNVDALEALLTEIWPKVRARLPAAELQIVGEISDLVKTPPEGVSVLGRLPDLEAIGGPDAVGLAPMRIASGVSIKVVTYLSLGMSVVALDSAMGGFDGDLDDLVVTAADTDAFADALFQLLSDPARRERLAELGRVGVAGRLRNTEFVELMQALRPSPPSITTPRQDAPPAQARRERTPHGPSPTSFQANAP